MISVARVVLRGSRRVVAASSGAPTTVPIAKAEMSKPTRWIDTFMSAMGGSSPESRQR